MPIGNVLIPATDQYPLSATVFTPENSQSHPVILINSAVGVNRSFYTKFAEYLQQNNFIVVTFDYRGMGDSKTKHFRATDIKKHEWGEKDINAVLLWIKKELNPPKIFVIGHSTGGTLTGLAPNHHLIDAMVTVGSQNGYWQHWPFPQKYFYAVLWYLVMPSLAKLLGYFPAKRLGLGENLPQGVALEWAKWCRNNNYLFCEDNENRKKQFANFTAPILAYSFSDDHAAPKSATEWLIKQFPNSTITYKYFTPQSLNVSSIGHFGLFKEKFKDSLWQEIRDWFKEKS